MKRTYSALEFQGFVVDCPTYDKDRRILEFKAKTDTEPPLQFLAKGELAQAFKNMLHHGCYVQIAARPKGQFETVGGKRFIAIRWHVRKMAIMTRRRGKNVGNFTDIRILDGLMPMDDEIIDVGYIDPDEWERREEAKAEIKRREALPKSDSHI